MSRHDGMPRAYLRIDPNLDLTQADPGAFVRLLCAAARQPDRGRFRDLALLQRAVGKARATRFVSRCDVVRLADGRYYVEGWDEWQEGDYSVADRMRRMRRRRAEAKGALVTVAPSPERNGAVSPDTLAPTLSVTTDAVSSTTPVKGISHGDGDGEAPIPPPSGGSPRANGTNPRAIAAEITRRANAAEAERKARRKARHVAYLDGRLTEAQRVEMDDRDAPLDEIPAVRGAAYQPMPPAAEPPADAGTESWFEPGGGAS
jgi:hypothetical protein